MTDRSNLPHEGMDAVIVIAAKAPRPGHAKTRLLSAFTAAQVAELHNALLTDTIALATAVDGLDVAIMCPRGDAEALARSTPRSVPIVEQRGTGLSAALTDVFETFCARGYRRVVALDSDSPHVPARELEAAVAALEDAELVIGPTRDGGYYLVGARAPHHALFGGDQLGTASALAGLIRRGQDLGLRIAFCRECYDIDVPDDVQALARDLREAPNRAPATAALLNAWRLPRP